MNRYDPLSGSNNVKVLSEESTMLSMNSSIVRVRDYKTLIGKSWLNDEIINFYIMYSKSNFLKDESEVLIFSSQFFQSLNTGSLDSEKRHLKVSRWTKKINIFEKKLIVIPIASNGHWYSIYIMRPDCLVSEEDTGRSFFILMDSKDYEQKYSIEMIRDYLYLEYKCKVLGSIVEDREGLSEKFSNIKTLRPQKPIQNNDYDCGIYTLVYLEVILKNESILCCNIAELDDLAHFFIGIDFDSKRESIATLIRLLTLNQNKGKILKFANGNVLSLLENRSGEIGLAALDRCPQLPSAANPIIHSSKTEMVCKICSFVAKNKKIFKTHKLVHSSVTCNVCNAEFVNDYSLKMHLTRKHKLVESPIPDTLFLTESGPLDTPSYNIELFLTRKSNLELVFDSHCHMDFIFDRKLQSRPHSYEDFVAMYPLMSHPLLEGFITNFIQPKTWIRYLSCADNLIESLLEHPGVYFSIGVHPHFSYDLTLEILNKMEFILMSNPKCVAVGEIGLDLSSKNGVDLNTQSFAFRKQIELALKVGKPLIFHIRDAENEAYQLLADINLPSDWPIHRHCWNSSVGCMSKWIEKFPNSVVGFTPNVTIPGATNVQRSAIKIPLSKLVLETDAPYFLPRGDISNTFHQVANFSIPMNALHVAAQIAALKRCEVNDVLRSSRDNIKRIYRV